MVTAEFIIDIIMLLMVSANGIVLVELFDVRAYGMSAEAKTVMLFVIRDVHGSNTDSGGENRSGGG